MSDPRSDAPLDGASAPRSAYARAGVDIDAGDRRDSRIDHFVEAAQRPANDEVGIARKMTRGAAKFLDRRAVDQMYRDAKRNPQRDADHRQRRPRQVCMQRRAAESARGERRERGKRFTHAAIALLMPVRGRARSSAAYAWPLPRPHASG